MKCRNTEAETLLRRAADALQEYRSEIDGDMNDSLAMEITEWLVKQKEDENETAL